MTRSGREFDIVLWGATGFTGSLVASYLLERYGAGGNPGWALAGRNRAKLDALKSRLGPGAAALPLVTADSHDRASLNRLASRTRVLVSTVGPYARYGSPLVAACVGNGTDYCDLAGEVQWIRQMIDAHHESASSTGARVVHSCGFDSVPMDIGTWYLQQQAMQVRGEYCRAVTTYVKAMRGGGSGGTFASMLNLIEEARRDRTVARIVADPYALNPAGEREGFDTRDLRVARYDARAGGWTAPFVMAGINTRVVRRSHALQGYPYGRDFRYEEALLTGPGWRGRARAKVMTAALGGLVFAASHRGTRTLLKSLVLPKPGEGPNERARESGYFVLLQRGEWPDGKTLWSRVGGRRDPGYGSTSRMLGECAVSLACDGPAGGGGVLTPASALAPALLPRLRDNAGMTFDIVEPPPRAAADD